MEACRHRLGGHLSTEAALALTIGLPVFFIVFVLARRSKRKD